MRARSGVRRRRTMLVLMLWAAWLVVAGCGEGAGSTDPLTASGSARTPAGGAASVSIPLFARLDSNPRLLIDVTFRGSVHRVVLDTGSVGLRLLASRLPGGVGATDGPAPPVVFGSSRVATGQLTHERVSIGGIDTRAPIAVELVTDVSCLPAHPRCGFAKAEPTVGAGTDGVLGISMQSSGPFADPLAQLPGGTGAVVHFDPKGHSSLQLGVAEDGFILERLRPAPAGASGWQMAVPVCFTAEDLPDTRVCGPTLFDTGTPRVVIRAPQAPSDRATQASTLTVGLADNGWSRTVSDLGPPAVVTADMSGNGRNIAGLPAFANTDIRYDLTAGTIGFRDA